MINALQTYTPSEILLYAAFMAMIINAINVCFWEGHIFQKIGDYMENHFPTLWKPIAGCIICMSPWWGALMVLVFGWPFLSVPVAMGINVLIVRFEPEKS